MLRTMIGLGLTLILLLGYAVYSNTVDTEYYRFETTNEESELTLTKSDAGTWFSTTNYAISWLNVSVDNLPDGSVLTISSSSVPYHHSELLGSDNDGRMFTCKDINDDFELIVESCIVAFTHSATELDGKIEFKSIVAVDLPLGGVGYIEATDIANANDEANRKIMDATNINTWTVSIHVDGQPLNNSEAPKLTIVQHELMTVDEFRLDPVVETLYGIASLIGCFTMMLAVPMIAYFSGVARQKREDRLRSENPPPIT